MRHPLLEKIIEADINVRLMALNGFAISYVNEIEDALFWAYWQVSGLPWEKAGSQFYEHVRFSHKHAAVDGAVKAALTDPDDRQAWFALVSRIKALLGAKGLRNVLGHNAVTTGLFQTVEHKDGVVSVDLEIRQYVSQKREMVELRARDRVSITEPTLVAYCDDLVTLLADIEGFLSGPLQLDSKRPLRYSRACWAE